jgi:hypothetical protein
MLLKMQKPARKKMHSGNLNKEAAKRCFGYTYAAFRVLQIFKNRFGYVF